MPCAIKRLSAQERMMKPQLRSLFLAYCAARICFDGVPCARDRRRRRRRSTPERPSWPSNAHADGVHVTASGLQYRILQNRPRERASGPKPADEVKVNYEGKLLDGTVFDSSYARGAPAVMTVRDLVPGWVEALRLMRPGDEWLLYLPPSLGYGAEGKGPIPPGSVLVFRLELIGVAPDPGSILNG